MINENLPANVFALRQSEFRAIPGSPWVYWVNNKIREIFIKYKSLELFARPRQGLATGENHRFLRFFWEVPLQKIYQNKKPEALSQVNSYVPYMKGGGLRKWFGNQWFIVNWKNDGREIRNFYAPNGRLASRPQNTAYYLREGITWSLVSTDSFGVRYLPPGFIFDVGGSCVFSEEIISSQ